MIPDWQLPPGVDRGLWNYLHADEMVASYDEQMRTSALAAADIAFCRRSFPAPGRLADLGCGTGRLCSEFAALGYDCVGIDLSACMLDKARTNVPNAAFHQANLVEPLDLPGGACDYAACLFSTIGMIRGAENRDRVVANAHSILKPGGRFVCHFHNRFFRGLGRKRVAVERLRSLLGPIMGPSSAGDLTMAQAYGGAPLTLHHFTKREAIRTLETSGFNVILVEAIGVDGEPARGSSVYGWLLLGAR